MNPIAISITRFVAGQDEPDEIDTLLIEPTAPQDWQLPPDALRRKNEESWRSVALPGGESIELTVTISTINEGFSLLIRQEEEVVAQLLCEGKPCLSFRTLSGDLIGIQVFDREQFQEALERTC